MRHLFLSQFSEKYKGNYYLNNKPYYQKLVLDQGYWKDSLITAPSDEAYRDDIIKAKELGFNGCRKHEKVEDPRFLYWADRLVISNDGWEMTETDICAFHAYCHGDKTNKRQQEEFAEALKSLDGLEEIVEKPLFAEDGVYQGQPVLLTEFGGISISDSAGEWGYTSVNKEEFIEEFRRIIEAVADSPVICGYCYTQLTDVEQEANGLLTQEHNHKFSPDKIREIQNIAGR